MSKNLNDVIVQVLYDLDVVGLGQSPSAEDQDYVSKRLLTILADLNIRSGLYIPDTDDIADELFETIVEYAVLRLGKGYGRPAPSTTDLALFEDRIKQMLKPASARRTLKSDPLLQQGVRRLPRAFNFKNGI